MVKSKPSRSPEGNESNILTDRNKGQDSKPKKYRGKKPRNKPRPQPEAKTDFQGQWTDLECYTFDLGPRASDKFARTIKELELYLGEIYSDSCQKAIMTETAATFPDPGIPTITNLGTERPKTDGEMTYLKKRISMRPSARILVRRMSINQTCTRYTISLWAIRINSHKRRWRRAPLYTRSRMTKTQWVTWRS